MINYCQCHGRKIQLIVFYFLYVTGAKTNHCLPSISSLWQKVKKNLDVKGLFLEKMAEFTIDALIVNSGKYVTKNSNF